MKLKSALSAVLLALITVCPGMAVERQSVVATIKPLHSLVAGVMGATGTPELLITGHGSPHEFQLKPSQVKALQSAAVLFYIDESFETFLRNAFEVLPAHVRKAPAAQKAGLTLLARRQGGVWEEQMHMAHEHGEEMGHNHDKQADHHRHDHDDMHVWLDPKNAEKIVTFITQELSAVYPENKDIYKVNARVLLDRLHELDTRLREELSGLSHKRFMVFHDAYHYFEKHYGLSPVGSLTFEPNEAPSPKRMKAVREKLEETKTLCVFREPYFSDKVITAVIEGSSAKIGTLDPEGTELTPGKDLYFTLMENLARNVKQCLSSSP